MTDEDYKQIVQARSIASDVVQDLINYCNDNHGEEAGEITMLVGFIALQSILVTALLDQFPPGSREGEEELKRFYKGACKDALSRWSDSDLKQHYVQGPLQ